MQHSPNKHLEVPRDAEFAALVLDLVPRIRALSPRLSDDEVLRAAERTAEYRLLDARFGQDAG